MQEIGIIQILLLSVWAFLSINEMLGPYLGLWHRPLIAGFGAGLILGDIQTGLFVGATLEMMSLGVHSYGGAVVPDYTTGAILGVTFGYLTGKWYCTRSSNSFIRIILRCISEIIYWNLCS